MTVLGIESSCDECSVAVVRDGRQILSHLIHSQIEDHARYGGVVPEIASRKHVEWILPLFRRACEDAAIDPARDLDAVAVTTEPGLSGSLLVGLGFAKGLAIAIDRPLVAVDHILAHLYAPRIESEIALPYLGLLVSGGHTIVCRVDGWDSMTVLGTTTDDACGEAFDKIAKYFGFGYPGGLAVDRLAANGDPYAYDFPESRLESPAHRYDVSYSGLKTAVVAQRERFRRAGAVESAENIAASFQRVAIDTVMRRLERAIADTGIRRVAIAGGVAANSYLRKRGGALAVKELHIPSMELCTDNAAMIAGIGFEYVRAGRFVELDVPVNARVRGYRRIGGRRREGDTPTE